MPNMRPDKNPMPHQDPQARACNFSEVALGYTREQAMDEAARCLNCKHMPCVAGCPVQIRIPEFIAKVAQGDFEGAYQIIAQDSALPAVCGRVCPQESQCEAKCVRGIKNEPVGIGRLAQRQRHRESRPPHPQRTQGSRHRLRPRGPDLRRGPGEKGL